MLAGKKVLVVMPAYNAASTLERTFKDYPFRRSGQVLSSGQRDGIWLMDLLSIIA